MVPQALCRSRVAATLPRDNDTRHWTSCRRNSPGPLSLRERAGVRVPKPRGKPLTLALFQRERGKKVADHSNLTRSWAVARVRTGLQAVAVAQVQGRVVAWDTSQARV